jgi:hypothetical protein
VAERRELKKETDKEKKAIKISKMRDDIAAYEKVEKTLSLPFLFEKQTHARTKLGDDGQTGQQQRPR